MKYLNTRYLLAALFISVNVGNVQAGDATAGESTYSSMGCLGCHGTAGNSMSPEMFPKLAGLEEEYLVTRLSGFRSGEITSPTMQSMASALTDEQIADLAAYLAAQ